MFLSKRVIAAFVPCPKCQRPATVHFPKGGPRKNAPYLVCPECGNQQNQKKDYFIDNAVKTLPEFIGKFGETEHTTAFADALEKHNPVIDNKLLVRMYPIDDEPEQVEEQPQKESEVKKQAVTYDEQGNVIEDKPANDDAEQSKEQDGSVLLVVVLVAAVVITGGYFVVKKIKQNKEIENAECK